MKLRCRKIAFRRSHYLLCVASWLGSIFIATGHVAPVFGSVSPTTSERVLFQDAFADGEADHWTVQRNAQWQRPDKPCLNSGQPAQWEVTGGELGIIISGGPGCSTTITPELDLQNIGNLSFEFDWHFIESAAMDRNVALVWQDTRNWYGVKVLRDEVQIEKVVNGRSQSVYNHRGSYPFVANQRYHFQLILTEFNQIQVIVNNQIVIAAEDQLPFIRGFKTVGLMASTGAISRSISFFDNIVVKTNESPTDVRLHVPLIKQTDPAWKNLTYDSATTWSDNPTIDRWGCALSAAVMLLHHYGITHLPGNVPLNPYSLDIWLKQQPDGYIGEGLVNWVAVTRLTYQVSLTRETPKLEYRWANYDQELLTTELRQHRPTIVNVPGHFVIADGVTTDGVVMIKDPSYPFTQLNQHAETPLSLRLFTPSQTDLSYLLIVHSPTTLISLTNSSGQIIPVIQSTEYLSADSETTTSTLISMIVKPTTDVYELQLLQIQSEPQIQPPSPNVRIYAYDREGNVSFWQPSPDDATSGHWGRVRINYHADDQSTFINLPANTLSLQKLLQILFYHQEITTLYSYHQLNILAEWAKPDQSNLHRYNQRLKSLIDQDKYITAPAKQLLLDYLQTSSS